MRDIAPYADRIAAVREPSGAVIGFAVTYPGGAVISEHPSMGGALAMLGKLCDALYGPMWTPTAKPD